MASYRVLLTTSAYPGVARGELIDLDPTDEATIARAASGVIQAVDSTPPPEPLPFGAADPEPAARGRGRRGRHDGPEGDDSAAEGEPASDGDQPAVDAGDDA